MKFSHSWHFSLYKLLHQLQLFASHVTISSWPTPSTTICQYTSIYWFRELLKNYSSLIHVQQHQRLLTHSTNYFSLCHIHLHLNNLLPDYFSLTNVSNNYYSLDYISPYFSPKHFKHSFSWPTIHNFVNISSYYQSII